ncbi:MAG TPA: hypothetical protein VFG63_06175 [Nocardioidaceae bacterium]|nr:hypothetical protein [Nocardioidaceae bacterium]
MTIRVTAALVAAFAVGLGCAGPAVSAEPRPSASVALSVSPYAEPLSALSNQTLAQYLSAHRAGDTRLRPY